MFLFLLSSPSPFREEEGNHFFTKFLLKVGGGVVGFSSPPKFKAVKHDFMNTNLSNKTFYDSN
jgi:hypothetical protein